ncbi:MAG: arylsulfotransferase family protein [Actinomycetota bacterium]|nr:arylsulfotransferase family protein [Actinomycetota bacterium]
MRLVLARTHIPRRALFAAGVLVALAALSALALAPPSGSAQPPAVYTYPIPGGQIASPQTQIAFRGVSPAHVGAITVTGSASGAHSGTFQADSDGRGGSFLPAQPFTPGETVTVQTSLNISRGTNGAFSFQVATPAPGVGSSHWPAAAPRFRGDVWQFHSRPDLAPASVTIDKRSNAAVPGDVFLGPQQGPVQDGPEIVDSSGQLVWFKALPGNDLAADVRVQSYHGAPVLTWWQGSQAAGVGIGFDTINDTSYRQIAVVHAANGLSADLHEFQLTRGGAALVVAEYPVYVNASSVHGSPQQAVMDSVVQEIDIPTGLVLFQWDSLDHIPLTDSYQSPLKPHHLFDYFHVNSVDVDHDGNYVLSARNTWAAYKVDRLTGALIWRLGGKHSSFKLANGLYWAFQHDVRIRSNNDWFVTLFDDDRPSRHQSRGIKLYLNLRQMTARQVAQHPHSPSIYSSFEGNFQQLSGRHDFLGWGQQSFFSEYDQFGNLVFDGHFIDDKLPFPNPSYRAYKFVWNGTPATLPALAAVPKGSSMVVYASWNGATNVASWRVLGGSTLGALTQVGSARRGGFETSISVRSQHYVAVQAIGTSGKILQTSSTIQVP